MDDREPDPVVHVVAAKEGGAHKARGYGRGRPNRRSYAFEVAPDGAEVTPRSFKGYTLGSYASNNLAHTNNLGTFSPTNSPSLHRPAIGSYSLFDEVELQGVGSIVDPDSNSDVKDEDGLPICGISILGPISPFFGALSLRHVGWSSYLLDNTLLIQRILGIVFSFATVVVGLVYGVAKNDYFLPFYSSVALLVFTRFFILTVRFKDQRAEHDAVNSPKKHFSGDAILYQGAIILQSYATILYFLAFSGWQTAATITRVTPNDLKSAPRIMSIILAFILLLDPILTPVPFRLPYILPTSLFVSAVTAITVLSHDRRLATLSIATSFFTSIAVGFIITIYARVIFAILHRDRILFALKPHTHVSPTLPDSAIPANLTFNNPTRM